MCKGCLLVVIWNLIITYQWNVKWGIRGTLFTRIRAIVLPYAESETLNMMELVGCYARELQQPVRLTTTRSSYAFNLLIWVSLKRMLANLDYRQLLSLLLNTLIPCHWNSSLLSQTICISALFALTLLAEVNDLWLTGRWWQGSGSTRCKMSRKRSDLQKN